MAVFEKGLPTTHKAKSGKGWLTLILIEFNQS